ncbi:MAG TPA: hypothetical protein VFE23_13980 [Usitatibacter sp.]|jgi:hypothetical protein|nr:hypothetical protein [Usitatibacter sp.]
MKKLMVLGFLFLVSLVYSAAMAQVPPVYDDFAAGYIDPAKWIVAPICGFTGYDCAREVRGDHLRLAVRGYGTTAADNGVTFEGSNLWFRNPGAIDTIRLRLKVTAFSSANCATNSEAAHPQFLVSGSFFNAGSGNPNDDVFAYLMVERRTDDVSPPPTSLRVGGFMSINGAFFNNVGLGTVEVGEAVQLTLRWDRTNHAFVVRAVKSLTTPSVVEVTMPYSQGDITPPASSFKGLQVGSFVPNCTTGQSFAAMDANIDNVRVSGPSVQ